MSWEYLHLKNLLRVSPTAALTDFDNVCAASYHKCERFEWSVKFSDGIPASDRFLFINKVSPLENLDELSVVFKHASPDQDNLLEEIGRIGKHSERLLLGYERKRGAQTNNESLRIYLQLGKTPEILTGLAPEFAELLERFRNTNAGLMLSVRFQIGGPLAIRLYSAFDREDVGNVYTRDLLNGLLGVRTTRFLSSHNRFMIAFDNAIPTQFYVALRANSESEMLFLANDLAMREPLLLARLQNLTWIGIAAGDLDCDVPRTCNIYVAVNG